MSRRALPLALASLLLAAPAAFADNWVEVKLDIAVGELANKEIDGHWSCYATSVMNSFWYLEQMYKDVYGTKLTGGATGVAKAREDLHKLIWDGDEGYTWKEAWEEKVNWIESRVKGVTSYKGMIVEDTTGWANNKGLTGKSVPTWDFLWKEIKEDEDVEIFFSWKVGADTKAHAVTLTSLKFDDTDKDGKWDWDATGDKKEQAKFDYRDPNSPNDTLWSDVSWDGSKLLLKYIDLDDGKTYDATIYGAFSESHVPLPAALFAGGALLGAMGLVRRARRRRG